MVDTNRERTGSPEPAASWPGEQQGREAAREMGEQAGRIADLASARARSFVSSAKEQAQQAADYVQEAVQQTRERVAEYTEGGFERFKTDALEYTRQQPMNALLIAAGIGLLIGWLTALGRR